MSPQPLRRQIASGTGLRAAARSRSRVARSARAIARWSAVMAGAALVIFRVYLFWNRLVVGELFDPAVSLRWLAAVGLLSALVVLRRMGVPLVLGRKAFVIWLLVVLLHASGRAAQLPATDVPAGVETSLIFVLPSTLTILGLGVLCATIASRRFQALTIVGYSVQPRAACRLSDGWRRGGTTRAPPVAVS